SVLVDGIGAVTPQNPVQPCMSVAAGVAEREAGRRVVLLQRLAHLEETRKVFREFAEACLVRCRLSVGHVTAHSSNGDAEPVVAQLASLCGSVGPSAILLAEVIGDVV